MFLIGVPYSSMSGGDHETKIAALKGTLRTTESLAKISYIPS
ncbi:MULTISPECIES: hypothetical protein [unclassified Mesorhizobium]|nr:MULTISPECIES: hypothetical protein [unclassified Mesorhizobium]